MLRSIARSGFLLVIVLFILSATTGFSVSIMQQATATPAKPLATPTGPSLGLDKFDSYQSVMKMILEGKEADGKDYKMEMILSQEAVKAQKMSHSKISVGGVVFMDFIESVDTAYLLDNKGGCTSFPSTSTSTMISDEIMKNIVMGKVVKNGVDANGIKADQYAVEQVKPSNKNEVVKSVGGEIFLAQSGGYIVKFTVWGEGSFEKIDFSGAAEPTATAAPVLINGKTTMMYDLTNVGKVKPIELPEACKKPAASPTAKPDDGVKVDFPLPANAANLENLDGEMITFSSPDEPAVVYEYYLKELPAKKWDITDKDDSLAPYYTIFADSEKASVELSVMEAADGKSKSDVVIFITKK